MARRRVKGIVMLSVLNGGSTALTACLVLVFGAFVGAYLVSLRNPRWLRERTRLYELGALVYVIGVLGLVTTLQQAAPGVFFRFDVRDGLSYGYLFLGLIAVSLGCFALMSVAGVLVILADALSYLKQHHLIIPVGSGLLLALVTVATSVAVDLTADTWTWSDIVGLMILIVPRIFGTLFAVACIPTSMYVVADLRERLTARYALLRRH
jgi:hypothetical protein